MIVTSYTGFDMNDIQESKIMIIKIDGSALPSNSSN
jgi:hypothetical protein